MGRRPPEHFLGDSQGRDNISTARMALDDKGRFLALELDIVADMGAYLSCYAPYIPWLGVGMATGVYDIPLAHVRLRAVYTNTVPVDAYRGAGRPEAAYLIERLVDAAARDIGVAPDALRRGISSSRRRCRTRRRPARLRLRRFRRHMARAQEIADWNGFTKRAAASKRAGKLRGIGLATYIEACGNNGPETANVRLEPDGGVTVLIGSQSTGQGHATAYAQLVAEQLDMPPERVRVVQGDTDQIATGGGTGGSSSIPVGGVSVDRASKKLADQLKRSPPRRSRPRRRSGDRRRRGARRRHRPRHFVRRCRRASGAKPEQLARAEQFGAEQPTYPTAPISPRSRSIRKPAPSTIVGYVIVDDFGMTLNPLLLAGQVHGGAVQGIGQALMEDTVYDRLRATAQRQLMDYALPRADDAPSFVFETRNVPCKTNPLGVKGAGEAGAIGSCPAVINAVVDALWRAHRIRHIDMPATPQRIWAAIEAAEKAKSA